MALAAVTLLAPACTSTVLGGGSSGDGGGGEGGTGIGGTGVVGTEAPTSGAGHTVVTSSVDASATTSTTGAGGGGGANPLGDCRDFSAGSGVGPGGGWECDSAYGCGIGIVEVACASEDTDLWTCDCIVDGQVLGTCDGEVECSFPSSCCYGLLGGDTTPTPGPYGDCEPVGSGGTSTGGDDFCIRHYECAIGGGVSIECDGPGPDNCRCEDLDGLTLGTCTEEPASCDLEGHCCEALFGGPR